MLVRLVAVVIAALLLNTAYSIANAQGLRGFGTPDGKLPLRGFGRPEDEDSIRLLFPHLLLALNDVDWAYANKAARRADRNSDQVITPDEFDAVTWDMRRFDLNKNDRIPLLELALGYTQIRLAKQARNRTRRPTNQQKRSASIQTPREPFNAAISHPFRSIGRSPQFGSGRRQTWLLSGHLMQAYDVNGDGVVQRAEFRSRHSEFGNLSSADLDGSGDVQRQELATWLGNRLPSLSRLSLDFQSFDEDRDGQVTLVEFSAGAIPMPVAEFGKWDRNGDGLITPAESATPPDPVETQHSNNEAFVIKPDATIVSPIWIEQDSVIDRLTVYVVVSKEGDNYTELHLIAPDGQRVLLFGGDGWTPWRGALILKGVTFSDEAPVITSPLKQPPPPQLRLLQPPGVATDGELSLVDLKGCSTRGTWKLVIRNQNNRTGLLLRWAMHVTVTGVQD